MGLTMATISLLFTVTLICEGTGMLFSALFESRVDGSTCFDIFVGTEASAAISDSSATAQTAAPQANNPPSGASTRSIQNPESHTESAFPEFQPYLEYVRDQVPLRASMQYHIYRGENLQVTNYIGENASYYAYYDYDPLMAYSDYAALRKMLGYSEATLEDRKSVV